MSLVTVCGGIVLSTVQAEHYNWMMAFHGNMDQTYCLVGMLTHLRAQVERGQIVTFVYIYHSPNFNISHCTKHISAVNTNWQGRYILTFTGEILQLMYK